MKISLDMSKFADIIFTDAGRRTPDAGRRTPDAGRRTPDIVRG